MTRTRLDRSWPLDTFLGPGRLRTRWLWLSLLVVAALDALTPLGFAHGLLYLPLVVLAAATASRHQAWALALAAAAATLCGVWWSAPSPDGLPPWVYWANRTMAATVLLLAGAAADAAVRLRAALREQVAQGAERTRRLEVASRLGRLGGWTLDHDSGRIRWSDELARLHGREPGYFPPSLDEALGYYPPGAREQVAAAVERCLSAAEPFDIESEIVAEGGARLPVRAVGQPVFDAAGRVTGAEGAFQDLSAEHDARRALRESMERWHALAESMPMIVWVATPDDRLEFVSGEFERLTGQSVSEPLTNPLGPIHRDDRQAIAGAWAQAKAEGRPFEASFRLRVAEGVYRWHLARAHPSRDAAGRLLRWYGSATDIDGTRRLQQQAEALSAHLQAALAAMTDGAILLDRDWTFTYVNAEAARLLQRPVDALVGRNLWAEFPEAVGTVYQQQYEAAMASGRPCRFEADYQQPRLELEVSAFPFEGGLAVTFREVSAQRALARQAEQGARLQSLGQLTGGVAHDFNNLLTVILGNAELLADGLPAGGMQHRLATLVGQAAQRGADLTQRLLAFARQQPLAPQVVDVNALVGEMDPMLRRTLGEDIDIEWVRSAGLWTALVDPGQLENAVLNLALNARDAMPGGGRLTIETANVRLDEAYAGRQADVAPGQYVMLAVSDTGEGIAAANLGKVFEPFFTTKARGKGTGLGLAMVYGFVKQSRGHVAIYSEPGRGTTVKLYLPRPGADDAVAALPLQAQAQAGRGELVLLVEDDALVREYAAEQIRGLGYRVLEAGDGPQALALLRRHEDVALLFTDVVMPGGMSGRELAAQAQALQPGLPVLYTSGYTENAIVHHGRLDPGVLLLGKPYRRTELARKLREALEGCASRAG